MHTQSEEKYKSEGASTLVSMTKAPLKNSPILSVFITGLVETYVGNPVLASIISSNISKIDPSVGMTTNVLSSQLKVGSKGLVMESLVQYTFYFGLIGAVIGKHNFPTLTNIPDISIGMNGFAIVNVTVVQSVNLNFLIR